MQKYLDILKRSRLFEGIEEGQILASLKCLGARVAEFFKGEYIFKETDKARQIGIVLSGEIELQKIDYFGNINIISRLYSAELIGAAASFSVDKRLPFDAVSVCETKILYLDNQNLVKQCPKACSFHTKIIENLIALIAQKNIQLSAKIDILTKRSIREKLISYLYAISKNSKSQKFSIPHSRRQLADFLSVNRSALIRELSSMKNDGIVDFEGNLFWFL